MTDRQILVIERWKDEVKVLSPNPKGGDKYYTVNLRHPDIFKRCECPQNIFHRKSGTCKHEKAVIEYFLLLSQGKIHPVNSPTLKAVEQHGNDFVVEEISCDGVEYYVVRPDHPNIWERCDCLRSGLKFKVEKCRHEQEVDRYLQLLKAKKIVQIPTFPSQSCLYC